jgi:hypothetical protein
MVIPGFHGRFIKRCGLVSLLAFLELFAWDVRARLSGPFLRQVRWFYEYNSEGIYSVDLRVNEVVLERQ